MRRRRPTDAQLVTWLRTGSPARVERWLDDPVVSRRLEHLTELAPEATERLRAVVEPAPGFHERTTDGVRQRVGDLERLGALLGLLGLGPRTARTFLDLDDP